MDDVRGVDAIVTAVPRAVIWTWVGPFVGSVEDEAGPMVLVHKRIRRVPHLYRTTIIPITICKLMQRISHRHHFLFIYLASANTSKSVWLSGCIH